MRTVPFIFFGEVAHFLAQNLPFSADSDEVSIRSVLCVVHIGCRGIAHVFLGAFVFFALAVIEFIANVLVVFLTYACVYAFGKSRAQCYSSSPAKCGWLQYE